MKIFSSLLWLILFLFSSLFTLFTISEPSYNGVLICSFFWGLTIPTFYSVITTHYVTNGFFKPERTKSTTLVVVGSFLSWMGISFINNPELLETSQNTYRQRQIYAMLNAFGDYSYIVTPSIFLVSAIVCFFLAYRFWGFDKKLKDEDYVYLNNRDT